MEKPMKKLLSAVVAAVMSLSAVPVAAFATNDLPQTDSFYDTLGYASKSQYVLYSESESSMQLNVNRAVINGNVYTNGNLDAYAGEVLVRGDLFVGKTVNKHEYTILDSYRYYENAQKGVMNDFEDEMTASLGEDYVTHEWWYTYSNTDTTLTDSVYAKSGLQFTGNNVTLGGTYVSESYLMISASHALTTAPDNQMNLYCQNGNIGIYVGDAQINGIIYAPNGTVQICGSDIEINGLVIAKEIQISAQDFTINEDPTLSMSENAWLYNDALLAITGSYNEESDSIDISMLSSLEEGTYSIFSSDDNAEFENVASVSENTYSLLLSDTNDIYIKAQQTFDNGFTIESNTIKFVYTENGFEEEISDTDNEGLMDLYEHIIGSDMNNADTDGDGLSDYIEASILGTDPRYTDTDEDGVTDAYEDNDSDRLTNIDEVNAKTDPTLYDTDGDQLSDYDEIYIYSTDPLLYDTDGDGLNDGDEISLGLDPLSADTDNNGIADNNEKFEQKVNTPELETFNTDNEYELSVDITSSGYAPRIIDVSESVYSEAVTSEAVLGKIVEIKAKESCNVSQVVLKFDIADEYTQGQSEILAENMQGIERFMVFKYFDQINMLLPIDTQYDIQNNLVYTAVDELGSYCVVDMEKWCSQLSSSVNQQTFSLYSARNDLSADTPIDIVFALRSYYTDSYLTEFESYRDMICDVSQLLFESYENVRVYIIEDDTTADFVKPLHYSSSGELYFDNTDDLKSAMNLLTASFVSAETNTDYPYDLIIKNSIFRNSPNRYVFEVGYEGENSVLNRNAFDYFVSKDLMYSDLDVNSDNTLRFKHYQMSLDNSGEIYTAKITERNENATAYDIFSYIEENLTAEDLPSADEDEGEYTIVLPTSWENVTLLGKLSPDNGIDTDGDTLTDWQEADTKSGLISIDENGNVSLPSIKECLQLVGGKKYVDDLLAKISNGDNFRLWSLISPVKVLPVRSNPLREDTDSDGYSDGFDPDISKTPDILGKYYDFLDGEIYGLHARDIYAYFALSSQGDIIIDGEATVSTNDNVKYRFEWCGNGYRIHPISDESLSLTVVKEQGEYSVKALPTNYTDEQIWEVLPYNENRDASISYYGLLIRSKVLYYESFDSKGEALFLSYSSDKATVSTERITNVSIDLRDIADWTRFGKAYMQYEGWLDGKNDDVDRAIKNYVYNSKIIVASDSKVHHNYNNAYVYLLLHQDSKTFESLIFGDNVKMSSVICEVMATYNAFVLKNIITNDTNFWGFYKLAVEFELSAKKINPFPDRENIPIVKDGRDGSFGCEPRDIENCFKAYRIKYLMYDKKDNNSSYKAAVQMNAEISINDIMIVAYGFDFLNLKIHTFSAVCNGVNSLILFNRITSAPQTTSGNSILDSIGDKRHFRVGYILV